MKNTMKQLSLISIGLIISLEISAATYKHARHSFSDSDTSSNSDFSPKQIKKVEKQERRKSTIRNEILMEPINYDYGYNEDDINFLEGISLPIKNRNVTTKKWTTLINIHGDDKNLWLGKNISGPFNPKKNRSLSWATSYEIGAHFFKHQESIHDSLALPLTWSSGKHRNYITFIVLPPHSNIEFKIGLAKEQIQDDKRQGGTVQMRLKYLPKGTILLTSPILEPIKHLRDQKGYKKIHLNLIFKTAIQEFNKENIKKIPLSITDILYQENNSTAFDLFLDDSFE